MSRLMVRTGLIWSVAVLLGAMGLLNEKGSQPPSASPAVPATAASLDCPVQTRDFVAVQQSRPFALALDARHVYWTNARGGTIAKALKHGGAVQSLAEGRLDPFALAVDAQHVYWTERSAGMVLRVSKRGGTPEVLATGQLVPTFIALDSSNIFWINEGTAGGDGAIMTVPKHGGSLRMLADRQPRPWALAADGTSVFWGDLDSGTIVSASSRVEASGSLATLALGQGRPSAIAVDDTMVYWVDNLTGQVAKVSKLGGIPTVLARDDGGLWSVALDAHHVYWTNGLTGKIGVVSKAGGHAARVTTGTLPRALAASRARLYWTEAGSNDFNGSVAHARKAGRCDELSQ